MHGECLAPSSLLFVLLALHAGRNSLLKQGPPLMPLCPLPYKNKVWILLKFQCQVTISLARNYQERYLYALISS